MKLVQSLFVILLVLSPPQISGDAVDDAMEQDLARYNVRGAGVTIFDSSQVTQPIFRGYGRVDAGSNSAAVTPDTTFMLASVAKVFTAAAVSVLVDRGVIGLDDDICNVIPNDWQESACRNPNFPNDKVTWRMLVTHRSSLREDIPSVRNQNGRLVEASYGPSGGYAIDAPAAGNPTCPLKDVTGFYRDFLTNKPTETTVGASMTLQGGGRINWYNIGQSNGGAWMNFRPGSRVRYSNFAVGYIAALVELASGQDFADFCRDALFAPLGMTNTAWFREDLPSGTREAVPVEHNSGSSFSSVGHYCFIDYASGELRTTASDMAKWASAMLGFGAPTLWSESTGEQVFRCQERNVEGNIPSDCEFAMGWSRLDNSMKANADSYFDAFKKYDWTNGGFHEGAEAGSQTHLIVLPNAGVFASVLTNTDLNDEFAPQKMAATLANTPLPNIDPQPTQPPRTPNPTPAPVTTPRPVSPPTPSPVTSMPTLKPTASPVEPTSSPVFQPTPFPTTMIPTSKPTFQPSTSKPVQQPSPTTPPATPTFRPSTASPVLVEVTASPISQNICQDDVSSQIWINSQLGFKTCTWLASKPYWKEYLCGLATDVNYYCRETCQSCDVYDNNNNENYTPLGRPRDCFDLDLEFYVNDRVGTKDCSWLQGSRMWKNRLCGYDTDADYVCRKTCGSCDYWN